ncbi:DUF1819 family protein [Rhizobium ruizarguesonis]|uniref:DUF1819 family protein n=1 Tax=Rhizobium ruizarguesonis TaxID=2081791 RepID=UPI001953D239|nr:DUF1819 family protein [Rhizobium ruizarguesonis]
MANMPHLEPVIETVDHQLHATATTDHQTDPDAGLDELQEHPVVTTDNDQHYKMSFVVGGLFLNESIDVVNLHRTSANWNQTRQMALGESITSLPKVASRRRTLREIASRLSKLNDAELRFFGETRDRTDQQALLWLAVCREYRIVHEFATEVVRERFLSLQTDLSVESFDTFFAHKAEWNDALASISATTRSKLRQVLFRIMREAGIISKENKILATYISPQLDGIIAEHSPSDIQLFPGLKSDRGIA